MVVMFVFVSAWMNVFVYLRFNNYHVSTIISSSHILFKLQARQLATGGGAEFGLSLLQQGAAATDDSRCALLSHSLASASACCTASMKNTTTARQATVQCMRLVCHEHVDTWLNIQDRTALSTLL